MKTLLNSKQLHITLHRLAHQLIENHLDFSDTAIIGLQPRGIYLSDRIVKILKAINKDKPVAYGTLDITFYRDDFNQGIQVPRATEINFSVEGKRVVLIDDVLHTGRTIRSAMDALLDFGRPSNIELLTLIDRHFSREMPIQPDYVGKTIDTIITQKVVVEWEEQNGQDQVLLVNKIN